MFDPSKFRVGPLCEVDEAGEEGSHRSSGGSTGSGTDRAGVGDEAMHDRGTNSPATHRGDGRGDDFRYERSDDVH